MYVVLVREELPKLCIGDWTMYDDTDNILFKCKTIELPNKGNKTGISCINYGVYNVVMVSKSNNFSYKHFWLLNVENRIGVKVHIANYVKSLRGCIGVGSRFDDIDKDGIIDVVDSKITLEKIIKLCEEQGYTCENKKDFKLTIKQKPIFVC